MTGHPSDIAVQLAMREAAKSPCRSKRGVVVYAAGGTGSLQVIGTGFNGPPEPFRCPGREACAGNCGKRSVHAEMRALRPGQGGVRVARNRGDRVELVHVELAHVVMAGATEWPGVKPCDGPSCWQCSREILDAGFVDWVWLYENGINGPVWLKYSACAFHEATLRRCEMTP